MTTEKKKLGFDGQWIDGTPVGDHVDSTGKPITIDVAFLEAVVNNYDPSLHGAPVVVGHPDDDAPAYGWVAALRVRDGRLERQFGEVDSAFEELVRKGYFKKRSDAFYLDPKSSPNGKAPYLRHVAFLGAQPPAIKGIRDIHFKEGKIVTADIDSSTTEFSEGEPMTDADKKAAQEEAKKSTREAVVDYLRELFGGKDDKTAASFSEADQQRLIEKATAAAEAKFSEELKKRDATIEELRKTVNTHGSSSTRAAIVSFCEDLQRQGKFVPAFKNMGIIEFMELLASVEDTKDTKVSVITFAENEEGKEVEKTVELSMLDWFKNYLSSQRPFIQFGEQFGSLRLKGDGSQIADPGQIDALRDGMGVKKPEVAAAK